MKNFKCLNVTSSSRELESRAHDIHLMKMIGLVACAVAAVGAVAEPVQLISGGGDFAAPGAASILSSLPGGSGISVVASLGGSARRQSLLNAIFGTTFASESPLSAPDSASSGAWLAASPSTGALVLDIRPTEAVGAERSTSDKCMMASFSLALADVVILHAPCVAPSVADAKDEFERIFSHHLSSGTDTGATLLLYVGEPEATGGLSAASVARACKEAWASAASFTDMRGTAFEDAFELETIELPSSAAAGASAVDEAVATIRARVSAQVKPPPRPGAPRPCPPFPSLHCPPPKVRPHTLILPWVRACAGLQAGEGGDAGGFRGRGVGGLAAGGCRWPAV